MTQGAILWLAGVVSFVPIVFLLAILFFCVPKPLPTGEGLANMPWWAPLGGAFAAICGLLFADKTGAGAVNLWRVRGGPLWWRGSRWSRFSRDAYSLFLRERE